MEKKKIAIVGAGVSGLLACKHAVEKGFDPMVFEARPDIGGVWARTIESTKLQTPKSFYQFSDFAWPSSVTQTFPDHNQVIEYIRSYTAHFNLIHWIKFNRRVISIDYFSPSDAEDMRSWDLWGGGAFSPTGKWNLTVEDTRRPSAASEVYEVDFLVLCIGKFSDLPNVPDFAAGKGPEVLRGQVLHSMDYAAMGGDQAAAFVTGRKTAVVGFQKSAVDLAAELANLNGPKHPCALLFRAVHWTVPDHLLEHIFRNLNQFSELSIHKPREGFFSWLLALLLSPLLWVFSKVVESYIQWIYPLKKYKMIPEHSFFRQISSCMTIALPAKFYERVEDGSLVLQQAQNLCFYEDGLIVDGMDKPLQVDIVIFATGYRSDEKLKNIFSSTYFQKLIIGSSAPFYRDCIHPRIPQLAILGYPESATTLCTTEIRAKWLAHFLAGKFNLPPIREMEDDVKRWEKCMKRYAGDGYKRFCASVLLQIYCNNQLCRDMGCSPERKRCTRLTNCRQTLLSELFAPYDPMDYADQSSH
ncbi:Flavin-containing monooxygenase [Bertholletia excelsa]